MLIKNLILGMLVSIFCLSFSGVAIACHAGESNLSFCSVDPSKTVEMNNIKFGHSPKETNNNIATYSSVNATSKKNKIDYSWREDHKRLATFPSANTSEYDLHLSILPGR